MSVKLTSGRRIDLSDYVDRRIDKALQPQLKFYRGNLIAGFTDCELVSDFFGLTTEYDITSQINVGTAANQRFGNRIRIHAAEVRYFIRSAAWDSRHPPFGPQDFVAAGGIVPNPAATWLAEDYWELPLPVGLTSGIAVYRAKWIREKQHFEIPHPAVLVGRQLKWTTMPGSVHPRIANQSNAGTLVAGAITGGAAPPWATNIGAELTNNGAVSGDGQWNCTPVVGSDAMDSPRQITLRWDFGPRGMLTLFDSADEEARNHIVVTPVATPGPTSAGKFCGEVRIWFTDEIGDA